MASVFPGRFTAQTDQDFVVFLIGMRFNKPWKVNRWWQVATAMPRMLRVLNKHPELGCLGYQQWFGRTTLVVQYWRDFGSLDRFARDKDLPHLEPWRQVNRAIRTSGDGGLWHETYQVRAGGMRQSAAPCRCSAWPPLPSTCRWGARVRPLRPASGPVRSTSPSSTRTEPLRSATEGGDRDDRGARRGRRPGGGGDAQPPGAAQRDIGQAARRPARGSCRA